MSHPKVIRSHVPMSMARLIRRLQIASEAGVAKTIWATLTIKGYLAEFALRQSSTSHDQPSATVIDSFIHTFQHRLIHHLLNLAHDIWKYDKSSKSSLSAIAENNRSLL